MRQHVGLDLGQQLAVESKGLPGAARIMKKAAVTTRNRSGSRPGRRPMCAAWRRKAFD
jgi:hypothetical protein